MFSFSDIPRYISNLCSFIPIVAMASVFLVSKRSKRRGNSPHCKSCDYLLVNLTSDRCPECGALIGPGNVVYGEPRWQKRTVFAWTTGSILAIVLNGSVLQPWLQHIDWRKHEPTSFLLKDFASTSDSNLPAFQELQSRESADLLSADQKNEIAHIAISQFAAPKYSVLRMLLPPYLENKVRQHDLSHEDQNKLFQQLVRLSITVPPTVTVGQLIPVEMVNNGRTFYASSWWLSFSCPELGISDAAFVLPSPPPSKGLAPPSTSIGPHVLKGAVHIDLYSGAFLNPKNSVLLWSDDQQVSAPLEVTGK
jgi:hypothetical protein